MLNDGSAGAGYGPRHGGRMRICRFRDRAGRVAHGRIDGDQVTTLTGDLFGGWRADGARIPLAEARLLAPIAPPNVIAVGNNYRAHVEEGKGEIPKAPLMFFKTTTTVADPGSAIPLPAMAPNEVDYEAELAVVIGRTARDVTPERALDHVLGYTCANDVSARDCQRGDGQWARGKSFDGFAPLGPWLETTLDPADARVRLRLNGQTMQDASTRLMIFDVRTLISHLSRCMTLLPGTVILTGTPSGVGFARTPPVYLRAGDRVEVEIDGIGTLAHTIAAATAAAGASA
jgi:2-keto-4-pentenoate hydratase/2-oxohepta-3-ene-1,7-dioic acid hydratase in catechol pathway